MSFSDLPFFPTGGALAENGKDGVSPTITVADITGGHRLTIVDATGAKAVDIMDGTSGTNGKNGTDGQTPFINASGNWQIGDNDTKVKAAGADGKNGSNGKDGIGIKTAIINVQGELVITYTDDEEENLGKVVGENGQTGPAYVLTDDDKAAIVTAVLAEINAQAT